MAHPAITPAAPGATHPRTPERRTEAKHRDGPAGAEDAGGEGGSVDDADAIHTANGSGSGSAEDAKDTRDKANADATSTLAAAAAVFESVDGFDSNTRAASNNLNTRPSPRVDSNPRPDSSTIPSYADLHVPNLSAVLRGSPYLDPYAATANAMPERGRSDAYASFNPYTSSAGASSTTPERGRSRTRGYHASGFVTALGASPAARGPGEGRKGGERDATEDMSEREEKKKKEEEGVQSGGVKTVGKEGGMVGGKDEKKKVDERTCARVLRRFWVWMWYE
jgi:hypothetical protein